MFPQCIGNFSNGFPPTLIQGGTKEKCFSATLFVCIKRWIKPIFQSNWTFMKECHMSFNHSFITLLNQT